MRIIKPVEFDPSEGSFSRASTGTYFDKDGVLRTAAVDEPRWNYTFEDGEWVGPELLVEGEGTTLLLQSEAFDAPYWSSTGSSVVVQPNTIIAPDGTASADKVVIAAKTGYARLSNPAAMLSGTAGDIWVLRRFMWIWPDRTGGPPGCQSGRSWR